MEIVTDKKAVESLDPRVVSWEIFEDFYNNTSILFDRIKYMVGCGIESGDLANDTMPYDGR